MKAPRPTDRDPFVPVLASEAARILERSVGTIHNMERDGRLPALKTPGGVRIFNLPDVELARQRAGSAAADLLAPAARRVARSRPVQPVAVGGAQ